MRQKITAASAAIAALCLAISPGVARPATSALLAPASLAEMAGATRALNSAPPALKADADAAMPTLRPYLITLIGVPDDTATVGLVQTYVRSRGTAMFNGWSGALSPRKTMQHPDMVGCLGVTRIQNWRWIASKEFAFDTAVTAEDSGDSVVWKTLVHKALDGTWLIA